MKLRLLLPAALFTMGFCAHASDWNTDTSTSSLTFSSKAEGEARRAREGAGDPPASAPSAPNSSRKARSERQPAHA